MTDELGARTIPFRPSIVRDIEGVELSEMYLDTGMVVVAPSQPVSASKFEGADKVEFYVAFLKNLETHYSVTGEVVVGAFDKTGGEVDIAIYPNNEIAAELRVFCVKLPIAFVGRVVSRYVAGRD